MRILQNMSIRRKQKWIIMLTSSLALLLACVAFITYDAFAFRREIVERVASMAEVVGKNTTAAIDFNDSASAEQTLAALTGEPNIVAAHVHTLDRREFARFTRAGITPPPEMPHVLNARHEFSDDHLHLFRPITQGGEQIGTIELVASLDQLSERLWRYGGIVAVVFAAALFAAFWLSTVLGRVVSRPILDLAHVARSVAQEKNYSVRATKRGNDELGELVDGFNEMLVQIQERDAALQAAREHLERRVEDRTNELARSVALLNATLDASVDGILAVDREGNVTCHNQKFVELWRLLPDVVARRNLQEMVEAASKQLKDPGLLLARVQQMQESPESEAFDVLEFRDGRIVERTTRRQSVGDRCVGTVVTFRDVTERKRAEEMLRRTEELYRQAIAGAGAVPYCSDFQTRQYLFMGEGIQQLIGYAPHEVNGALWKSIIQKSLMLGEAAGLEKSEAARRMIRGDLQHWRCDMLVTTRDGKSRWISDASVQSLDESGKPTGSMGILQDITERKRAEITASAFSKLGRRLSVAASREEAARIISEVSDELFGWEAFSIQLYSSREDMVRCIFEMDLFDGQRLETTDLRPRKATALHHRVFASGAELILREPTAFLPEATPFGNRSRPSASIMYVPVRTGGDIVGILSIHSYFRNAYTEQNLATLQTLADHCGGALQRIGSDEALRESESQFRLVWDTSVDGMRLADRDGTVLMVNDAYCRMVEKSKAEIEGHSLALIHSAENAEQVLEIHRQRVDAETTQSHLEVEATLWNGRKVWFEMSNSKLILPGHPPLLLSIFRDITGRKQAEVELESMHRQLLGVSRQAGMAEVATSVLHNVGNVLNSVNTSASVLTDRLRNSQMAGVSRVTELLEANRHDLAGFLTANGRADQVINFLKSLSQHLVAERANALEELEELTKNVEHIKEIVVMQQSYAKVSGVSEKINPTDLVEDALRMNAGALARHQLKLVRDYAPDMPEIMVEKHKVLQILVNLIRNAKYACDDSNTTDKRLTVRVTHDHESVRIAVVDNGVGIPVENLARIFNHGFTTRKNGHGFGLHSGALAAQELGGKLTAHSEGPGQGATFTLELPCHPPELVECSGSKVPLKTEENYATG